MELTTIRKSVLLILILLLLLLLLLLKLTSHGDSLTKEGRWQTLYKTHFPTHSEQTEDDKTYFPTHSGQTEDDSLYDTL